MAKTGVSAFYLPNFEMIDNEVIGHETATQKKINLLCLKYGGVRTKLYSQGNTIIGAKKYYSQMKDRTWGGVCFSMVLHWIAMHANDIDFWGWLDANNG